MSNAVARVAFICALVAVTASCSSGSRSSRPAPGPQPSTRPQPVVVVTTPAPAPARGPAAGRGALGVPPGHLPPPGSCRLWFPGRPPGQQPRPGACVSIMRQAPAGAWVLYRPQNDAKVIHTRVIDPKRPGVVVTVRVYDSAKGTFLREEKPAALERAKDEKPNTPKGDEKGGKGEKDEKPNAPKAGEKGAKGQKDEKGGKGEKGEKDEKDEKGGKGKGGTN